VHFFIVMMKGTEGGLESFAPLFARDCVIDAWEMRGITS
jgi:hypothetical protein